MSNKAGRARKRQGDRFVRFFAYEMAAPAWRAISPTARALLLELRALYQPSQANVVFLSEREAGERLGIDRKTARKAFAELLAHGWIRREVSGSFSCKAKIASSYRLTNEADASPGSQPTKDYMRWKPDP